jgi:hypothetical protein
MIYTYGRASAYVGGQNLLTSDVIYHKGYNKYYDMDYHMKICYEYYRANGHKYVQYEYY